MDGRDTYDIRENVSTKTLTTLRAGGPARFSIDISDARIIPDIVHDLTRDETPYMPMGGGSNVLFSDEGYSGCLLVMKTKSTDIVSDDGERVRVIADAGVSWDEFVTRTIDEGLWGLENLSGIPGTVGATPVQNVGAYGTEVRNVIAYVDVYDTFARKMTRVPNEKCAFGYRDSIFKHAPPGQFIITSVAWTLSRVPAPNLGYKDLEERFVGESAPTLADVREAVLSIRAKKFPDLTEIGTAGSFFKNPILPTAEAEALMARFPGLPTFPAGDGLVKVPLAWILDHVCHLKGYRQGNVALFDEQPLVLVAYDGATANEINAFALDIEARVHEMTRIAIEREVHYVA